MSTNEDLMRCHRCNGRKTILGLGMIEKQCHECFGIGWVAKNSVEIKKAITNELPIPTNSVVKKKPGRKPKTVLQCEGE